MKNDFKEIQRLISEINNEEKIFGFKILKKPDNLQTLLLSINYSLLRVIIFCKRKWKKLVKNSLNENSKNGGRRFINIFFIGLFNFFASPPINFVIILPLTFGSLFYILDHQKDNSLKSQISILFAFIFGHFVSIFWWFFIPLTTDFLHLFWLTPFAILGLPFIMSVLFLPFFAVFSYLWDKILLNNRFISKILGIYYLKINDFNNLKLLIVFIFTWFCGDFVRAHIIVGGFPWMMLGHFVNYSVAFQSVRWLGVDLYSLFFLLLILTPYLLIFKRKNKIMQNISLLNIFLWIINIIIGSIILLSNINNNKINANIVGSQINYPASLNMGQDYLDILNKNIKNISWLSHSDKNTIMLMPEGSINQTLKSGSYFAKSIGNVVPNDKSILLGGGLYVNEFFDKKDKTTKYDIYNVIYAIDKDGDIIDLYKKQKLVPFGEYLPIRSIIPEWLVDIMGGMIDLSIDKKNNDLFVFYRELPIIYPTICYESIFPSYVKNNILKSRKKILEMDDEYLKENNIKNLNERGEIIVNLTNDVWMGWSTGAYQHFLMARFLAVYTGLPVIRVSNNGISAYIDKCGIVKESTKLNRNDILYIHNI